MVKKLEIWPTLVGGTTVAGSGAAGSALELLLAVSPTSKSSASDHGGSSSSTKLTFSLAGEQYTLPAVGLRSDTNSRWAHLVERLCLFADLRVVAQKCFHARCSHASVRVSCSATSEQKGLCAFKPRCPTIFKQRCASPTLATLV